MDVPRASCRWPNAWGTRARLDAGAQRLRVGLIGGLIAAGLAGCAGTPIGDMDAEDLYERARASLESRAYTTAVERYETLEARYPFSEYARQAQLEIAYAYYKFGEPDSAIDAVDRFLRRHPRHPNVDYAYYIKGLADFYRGHGFLDRLTRRDPAERDPTPLRDAFGTFQTLVRRYPDSQYADDAEARMDYLRNQLARHELDVADFYMRREAYLAAARRATYLIENYPDSAPRHEALQVLAAAYEALGLDTLETEVVRRIEQPPAESDASPPGSTP